MDGDFNNNDISNLQILDRVVHAKLDVKRIKIFDVECIWCGNKFTPSRNQITKRAQKCVGPFCSRNCAGSYGKSIQLGKNVMNRGKILTKSYTRKQEPIIRKSSSGDDDIGETFNNGNPEGTRKGHRRD